MFPISLFSRTAFPFPLLFLLFFPRSFQPTSFQEDVSSIPTAQYECVLRRTRNKVLVLLKRHLPTPVVPFPSEEYSSTLPS